jgi:hypothetical protein
MPVVERVEHVGGKAERGAFPIHFSLLDEHDQASLAIDQGLGSPCPLTLHITNRSGHEMEWEDAKERPPSREFHHLRIAFRPGILSKTTLDKLKAPETAQQVLAPKKPPEWRIALDEPQEDESPVLLLVYTPQDKSHLKLKNDASVKVRFHGIVAGHSAPHGLTRVEFWLDNVKFAGVGEIDSHATWRHRHLSVQASASHELPLRIGFKGHAMVRADGQPDTLTVVVQNPVTPQDAAEGGTPDIRVVGRAVHGHPAQLVLSFDLEGPWQLPSLTQNQTPEVEVAYPGGNKDKISAGRGQGHHDHTWAISLPERGIAPGESLQIEIKDIVAWDEGTINLYLDGSDIPGFRTRVILPITATNAIQALNVQAALLRQRATQLRYRHQIHAELTEPLDLIALPEFINEALLQSESNPNKSHDGWASPNFEIMTPFWQGWYLVADPYPEPAADISRRFALFRNGRVCPVLGGGLQDALPLPPSSLAPFTEIGEIRGAPIILNQNRAACLWSSREKRWRVLRQEPVLHVGDGWAAMEDPSYLVLLTWPKGGPSIVEPEGSIILNAEYDHDTRKPIQAVGGTEDIPLFVDAEGNVWRLEGRSPMKWKQAPVGQPVADINSQGVVIRKGDSAVLRYSTTGGVPDWRSLEGGGVRIGGTWRNPIVTRNDGKLWRLEDFQQ